MAKATDKGHDGGYAWIITLGSSVNLFMITGVYRCIGILLLEWKEEFDASSVQIAWIATTLALFYQFPGPLAGILSKAFGHRLISFVGGIAAATGLILCSQMTNVLQICLTTGIVTGLGFALSESPSHGIIGEYFSKKYPTASGLTHSGCALSVILFPLLFDVLLSRYGWRGTLLVLGSIVANICPFSLLFRPVQKQKNIYDTISTSGKQQIDSEEQRLSICDQSGCRMCMKNTGLFMFRQNSKFVTMCVINCLLSFGYSSALVYLPSLIRYKGLSTQASYIMLSLLGTGSLCGRACTGIFVRQNSKIFGARNWYVFTTAISGLCLFTTTFINSSYGFVVFSLVFGWASGLCMTLTNILLRQFVGAELFTNAFGYLMLLGGIGELTAPVFVGFLFDTYGDYNSSFYTAAAAFGLIGPLILLVTCCEDNKYDERVNSSDV